MDMDALKPILAGLVRHGLTSLGGALVAGGYMQSSDTSAFIGGGMVIAGMAWSWWQKEGQAQVSALLKKMTDTKTKADAVKAAEVLPPSAAVDTALKSASAQSAVAKILIAAFVMSLFLAGAPAMAQGLKLVKPTGNIPADIQAATTPDKPKLITGNVERDAHAVWDKIVAASNADLKYASALAGVANTPASGVRKQCYDAILELNTQVNGMNLKDANGNPLPQPDPKLFTGVEQAAETIDNLAPSGKLFTSCAGMAQLTKTNVLTLINAIVTGAAGFAAMPIIPGL